MPPAPPPAPPASLKLGNKQLEDLLLWKDVKTSGVVFGACTGLYILFGWSGMSAITVVAWLLMLVVATCSLWQHMAIPFGRPGPPVPLVLKQGFTEEEMKPLAEKARVAVNQALALCHVLVSGQNVTVSLKAVVALLAIGKVASFFSFMGLFYTVVVLAFTLPKGYEMNKGDIDRAMDKAGRQVRATMAQATEFVNKNIIKPSKGPAPAPSKKTQ